MKKKIFLVLLLTFMFMGIVKAEDTYFPTFTNENVESDIHVLVDQDNNPTTQIGVHINKWWDTDYSVTIAGNLLYKEGTDPVNKITAGYAVFVDTQTTPFDKTKIGEDANGCKLLTDAEMDENDFSKPKKLGVDLTQTNFEGGHIFISSNWYLTNGYDWAYLVIRYTGNDSKNYCAVLSTPVNMKKSTLAMPAQDKRYTYTFSGTTLGATVNLYHINNGLQLVTKIGEVTDSSLLTKWKNNDSTAFAETITKAKADTSPVVTKTYNDSASGSIDLSSATLVEGKYYYVYTKYVKDTGETNSEFRDTAGINIAQAVKNNDKVELKFTGINYDNLPGGDQHGSEDPTQDPTQDPSQDPSQDPDPQDQPHDDGDKPGDQPGKSDPGATNPDTGAFITCLSVILLLSGLIVIKKYNKGKIFKI